MQKNMSLSQKRNRLTDRARCVAIWIGDIQTEMALDEYLRFEFPYDFEVQPAEKNQPEIVALPEVQPIGNIIDGFSQCRFFLKEALEAAEKQGVHCAYCAVIYYYVYFDDEGFSPRSETPLKFLGNITWQNRGDQ
jgi:hypothetical protein